MRDLYSKIVTRICLAPGTYGSGPNGGTVDLRGMSSACFVVTTGAIAGAAAMQVRLQESDDAVTFTDVPLSLVDSSAPVPLTANGNFRLGYRGSKRYARVVGFLASGTTINMSACVVLEPLNKPVL